MLVLLLVLQRFGRRQWGWISELSTGDCTVSLHPINSDGTLGSDEVGVNFYPEDKVHSNWTLLGRATTVVGANIDVEHNSGTTVGEHAEVEGDAVRVASRKGSEDVQWMEGEAGKETGSVRAYDASAVPTESHPRIGPGYAVDNEMDEELSKEWRDYYRARDDYREAHGKIVKIHNLVLKVSWPEASRLEEWKIIKHAETLGKDDKFIRGHLPEVKYARDFGRYSTHHIRDFLGLRSPGMRTLRLIVMNRLRSIYDLDGRDFWKAFWECVTCMRFLWCFRTFTDIAQGHYRLWVNGIHHGDISLNNLMYDTSATNGPAGILNDFDLATWVDHSTTNDDRTGTIPFMAIDMLDGGLDDRIPRLYRHDLEAFIWVLAYVTVADIEYKDHTIEISPLPTVDTWFRDDNQAYRKAHISSKRHFHSEYDQDQEVSGRYCYTSVVKQMICYWCNFHRSLQAENQRAKRPNPKPPRRGRALREPEDGDPAESLELFITTVENSLGEGEGEGFKEIRALLLEAIETQIVAVSAM